MSNALTSSKAARGLFVGAMAAAWLGGVSACGHDAHYDYAQICRDDRTGQRLPDSYCQSTYRGGGGYVPHWYWFPLSRSSSVTLPPVWQRVSPAPGGLRSAPRTGRVATGISEHGTSVSHGGFGHGGHAGSSGE